MNCKDLKFPVCLDAMSYTPAERYQHLNKCDFCQKIADKMFPEFKNVQNMKFKE